MIRLAYDVGPGAGLGHRTRMRALTAALADRGRVAELVPIDDEPIDGETVIIDSYRHRGDDVGAARHTVAIDDLGRDLAVDLLVDPAPGAPPLRSAPRRVLVGLKHALIDPRIVLRDVDAVRDEVGVILVTAGGADRGGVGMRIAGEIHRALPNVEVRAVVGPWSTRGVAEGVKPVHAPDGLIDELASADVVVTAAGVTLLESLALGRPTIAIQRATNQRRYFEALTRASAAVGSTVGAAARDAARLTRYPARRRELSRTAREHVDGDGARRVARAIIELD